MDICKKYVLHLQILIVLTIILALHALNRLYIGYIGRLYFDYFGRNFIEHLLTGFYVMPIILCILYSLFMLFSCKLFIPTLNSNFEKRYLIISTIIIFLFECGWQFVVSPNSGSIIQMFALTLGIILFWLYFYIVNKTF